MLSIDFINFNAKNFVHFMTKRNATSPNHSIHYSSTDWTNQSQNI